MARTTTINPEQIKEFYGQLPRLTHQQIADACGCSRRTVQNVLYREGIAGKNKKEVAPQSTPPGIVNPADHSEESDNSDFSTDSPDRANPESRPAI